MSFTRNLAPIPAADVATNSEKCDSGGANLWEPEFMFISADPKHRSPTNVCIGHQPK